jgi:hypothetical protein
MLEVKPGLQKRQARSGFALTVPRQHGAWSMLLAGFVLGLASGQRCGAEGLLLLVAVLFGFWARHAAGLFLRSSRSDRRAYVLPWAVGYASVSLLAGALLVVGYHRWLLLPLGGVVLVLAGVSVILERRRQDRTTVGELVGVLGLSVVIPAAAYAATGVFAATTAGLWALGALFFGGSVFHVRYLVRHRRESGGPLASRLRAGGPSVAYHLAALTASIGLSAVDALPPLAPLSLLPVTVKALWTVGRRREGEINVRHIGYVELAHTLIFVVLAMLAFHGPG